jgi:hypothetical protein
MEDTNTIEREISSVRSEIRREQNELSRDPIGPPNPAIAAEINANERTLKTLEQKEERTNEYEQSHGFGY